MIRHVLFLNKSLRFSQDENSGNKNNFKDSEDIRTISLGTVPINEAEVNDT
jgi:hypothetical protein